MKINSTNTSDRRMIRWYDMRRTSSTPMTIVKYADKLLPWGVMRTGQIVLVITATVIFCGIGYWWWIHYRAPDLAFWPLTYVLETWVAVIGSGIFIIILSYVIYRFGPSYVAISANAIYIEGYALENSHIREIIVDETDESRRMLSIVTLNRSFTSVISPKISINELRTLLSVSFQEVLISGVCRYRPR